MFSLRTLIPVCLTSLACLTSQAGEVTIEPAPFTITQTVTATVLPEKDHVVVPPIPTKWDEWIIRTITPHGTRVAKGDVLVEFDRKPLEQKIEDAQRSITAKSLALAQTEQDLVHLKATAEQKLDALRTASRIATEDWEYFTKTRRNAEERGADQSLDRAQQYLANEEEELLQLKKMYEADDLTENTEEIILTRQENAVRAAKFAVEMETLRHKRTREVQLPREAVTLQNQNRDAALALEQATQSIPRDIETKTSALAALQTDLQREKNNLNDWQKDLPHMKILAPADGWYFHGIIEKNRWTTGESVKSLVPGGSPNLSRPFATFIPDNSQLVLIALTDDTTARALSPNQTGKAIFPGREELDITATVGTVSPTPATDGKHTLLLRATWPKDFLPAIGTTASVRVIAYHKDSAIVIPSKALHFGKDGFSVSVKLADGKTERRPVRGGRISGDQVEILEGLEKGQVVVVPNS